MIEQARFVPIPRARPTRRPRELTPTARLILAHLARSAKRGEWITFTNVKLAEEIDVCARAAGVALKSLQAKRRVEIDRAPAAFMSRIRLPLDGVMP